MVLERLSTEHAEKARQFACLLSQLLRQATHANDAKTTGLLCEILLSVSSSQKFSPAADDDYYGYTPLRWSDLLLEHQVVPTLLKELEPSSLTSCVGGAVQIGVVSNILGNLVQDAGAAAVTQILPSWSTLVVANLPATSYLCAAMAQKDGTSLAMALVQPMSTPQLVAMLGNEHTLQNEAIATNAQVDVSWFLEGVTRREDEAVYTICRDQVLLQALKKAFEVEIKRSNIAFLFPACKTLGNIAVACGGSFVPYLLDFFGPPLLALLQQGQVLEVVPTVATLLCDAGVPEHASTTVGITQFVPALWHILVATHATFEWKREVMRALDVAFLEPSSHHPTDTFDATALIWRTTTSDDQQRIAIFDSMIELIQSPDSTACLSALIIFDALIRKIPSAVDNFIQDTSGVADVLNEICNRSNDSGSGDSRLAELSAELLDDYFEADNSDHDDENDGGCFASTTTPEGTFAFGSIAPQQQQQQVAFQFGQPLTASSPPSGIGRGRGRGRLTPAWMVNGNES